LGQTALRTVYLIVLASCSGISPPMSHVHFWPRTEQDKEPLSVPVLNDSNRDE